MDERLFFQLAATLIPAFLLAGALSPLLRPGQVIKRGQGRSRFARLALVMLAIGIALLAELVAIDLSLEPESTWWKVGIAVYTLAGLSALVGVGILEPWYRGVGTIGQTRTLRILGASIAAVACSGGALYLVGVVNDVSLAGQLERDACRQRYLSDLTDKLAADSEASSKQLPTLIRPSRARERVRQSKLSRAEKAARLFALDQQLISARSEVPGAIMVSRAKEISRVLQGGPVPDC